MNSIDLEELKFEIIDSIFRDVPNRRKILISYLYYINKQEINEFSMDFNHYILACTPDNEKIPSIGIAIFDDIIKYIIDNNINIDEMHTLLYLPLYDKIAWYIRLLNESKDNIAKVLELPEEAL